MAFFDYDRNGKKDWKDNAREYYLYNKLKCWVWFCTIVFYIYVLYDVACYDG